ncbi:MAG: hypothetical protein L0Z70_13015 [Chloroflexi bacterium]|nr:hypothetical protein [Chloroflexota bacterium]
MPRYPTPLPAALRIAWGLAHGRPRPFAADAAAITRAMQPPLRVEGGEHIPSAGPRLLTVNHYCRRGFHAWTLALAVSAAVPAEVHWLLTSAWTYPDALRSRLLTPASQALFRRIAALYGFTAMPPMPPRPQDAAARAAAVREMLAYARRNPQALIGYAPEGRDILPPGGKPGETPAPLGAPPPGAGRFALLLAQLGFDITPIAAFEQAGEFTLRFGAAYRLEAPGGLSPGERDRAASRTLMTRIAALLPAGLRGEYG